MKIPRCPECGECKILLAPINANLNVPPTELVMQNMPVACSHCSWRGTWADVPYRT